jgi:hypothetical protein
MGGAYCPVDRCRPLQAVAQWRVQARCGWLAAAGGGAGCLSLTGSPQQHNATFQGAGAHCSSGGQRSGEEQ